MRLRRVAGAWASIKFWLLIQLLKWYGGDMDQWDLFRIKTKWGQVYVEISLEPHIGLRDKHYREIK